MARKRTDGVGMEYLTVEQLPNETTREQARRVRNLVRACYLTPETEIGLAVVTIPSVRPLPPGTNQREGWIAFTPRVRYPVFEWLAADALGWLVGLVLQGPEACGRDAELAPLRREVEASGVTIPTESEVAAALAGACAAEPPR